MELLFGNKTIIKKADVASEDRVIYVNVGGKVKNRKPSSFYIPKGVEGVPYKKMMKYYCDVKTGFAIGLGKVVIDNKDINEIKADLVLIARKVFWKYVGGRAMTLTETLLCLGAGYGFLRLCEFFIITAFAK